MAHAAVHWVITEVTFPKEVKPPARWLLVHIADRADRDTWDCYPSHKTLANDAGMSPRAVLDLLFVLEEAKLITRTPRFRDDGKRSTDLITLSSGYATTAVPDGSIGAHRPQQTTSERANAAAQNLVTEPGKGTVSVMRAPEPFEEWWKVYPRKIAKVAARKAWAKATAAISTLTLAVLMERTRAFADHVIGKEEDKIPHAATWLNGERWNDELPARSQTDGRQQRAAGIDPGLERNSARRGAVERGAGAALNRPRRWSFSS